MERQNVPFFPSIGEYYSVYGLTNSRLKRVRDSGIYVMHPGPVNRGVELNDGVMTYDRCLINQQVENGIAIRMSVLYWLKPGSTEEVKA
jgi:aspartate carbamoyltransferase catalytic subunit